MDLITRLWCSFLILLKLRIVGLNFFAIKVTLSRVFELKF